MVVTAGASDRQPQERLTCDVDLIVDIVRTRLFRIGRAVQNLVEPQVRRAERRLERSSILSDTLYGQQVARNVLTNELIVRNVFIEGADHVVAIAPRLPFVVVVLMTIRFGIANEIEPVPRPAFSIVRRCQQPFDHLLKGVGRFVVHKGLRLCRSWGQSDQVERHPSNQRSSVRRRSGLKSLLLEFCEQECIDRRLHPVLILHGGNRGTLHGMKRPEFAGLR